MRSSPSSLATNSQNAAGASSITRPSPRRGTVGTASRGGLDLPDLAARAPHPNGYGGAAIGLEAARDEEPLAAEVADDPGVNLALEFDLATQGAYSAVGVTPIAVRVPGHWRGIGAPGSALEPLPAWFRLKVAVHSFV